LFIESTNKLFSKINENNELVVDWKWISAKNESL